MDWLVGLLQSVFSNLVADAIFALLVAAGIAILKLKNHWLASPLLYGLAALMFITVSASAIRVQTKLPRTSVFLTPANAGSVIHGWYDKFGYGVRKLGSTEIDPNSIFTFEITPRSGTKYSVSQRASPSGFLLIGSGLALSEPSGEQLRQLSPERQRELIHQLRIELLRMTMMFSNLELPLDRVRIQREVPLLDSLTENVFMDHARAVEGAMILVKEIIRTNLEDKSIRITIR